MKSGTITIVTIVTVSCGFQRDFNEITGRYGKKREGDQRKYKGIYWGHGISGQHHLELMLYKWLE